MEPLVVLALGIATVLGLIIVGRVNAFVALLTAAMLVSVLSPGEMSQKIGRVAEGFGRTATGIAIVIGLAAIIGKCMMDSGAADRIVLAFQRLLGVRRTSIALLASGYILSIPVFFDTVFYLLVPLARSLWRRTRKDYVLYVTAIAAGAVITHSLVPPTPGPLIMAETFKIDLGLMILVGALIGIPMAAFSLVICQIMNRWMPIEMRPYPGEEEAAPTGARLPNLTLSLAPVLLPVILISANTLAQIAARTEREALLRRGDVMDWPALTRVLAQASTASAPRAARPLRDSLPEPLRKQLERLSAEVAIPSSLVTSVQESIILEVNSPDFWRNPAFIGLALPPEAQRIQQLGIQRLTPEESRMDPGSREQAAMARLNEEERKTFHWHLLQAAFPQQVRQTRTQWIAGVFGMLGNANLALWIAAVIAMGTLVYIRGLSLPQLGQVTENALMSAGIIILITAGGGAFGAMLREAGIQTSVQELLGGAGQASGVILLVLGFLLASIMKVAQGSGTVSMITASSMMAAIGATPELLHCHPVYLAVAIGCGSVCGSWMNDSGFWIFARMGGFTEIESLKTWTLLLIAQGVFGLGVTILAATIFPLI